jgi:hypothetical protein
MGDEAMANTDSTAGKRAARKPMVRIEYCTS